MRNGSTHIAYWKVSFEPRMSVQTRGIKCIDARMKTSALLYLLALPALAADTAIVGKVVGEHNGGTL